MDRLARSSAEDRLAAINETASRLDLPSTIIEKDFWVCWTLRRLAANPELQPHLTFKGGTSLSKAYGVIDRFSEDIDLTIGRKAPLSGTHRRRRKQVPAPAKSRAGQKP